MTDDRMSYFSKNVHRRFIPARIPPYWKCKDGHLFKKFFLKISRPVASFVGFTFIMILGFILHVNETWGSWIFALFQTLTKTIKLFQHLHPQERTINCCSACFPMIDAFNGLFIYWIDEFISLINQWELCHPWQSDWSGSAGSSHLNKAPNQTGHSGTLPLRRANFRKRANSLW